MNNLFSAKTKVLTYAGTTDTETSTVTVAPSGTRVCLRGYGVLEYPSGAAELENVTKAIFMDGDGTEVFSSYSQSFAYILYLAQGGGFRYIEIPGYGVLFDGLKIKLAKVSPASRTTAMRTVLNLVYT